MCSRVAKVLALIMCGRNDTCLRGYRIVVNHDRTDWHFVLLESHLGFADRLLHEVVVQCCSPERFVVHVQASGRDPYVRLKRHNPIEVRFDYETGQSTILVLASSSITARNSLFANQCYESLSLFTDSRRFPGPNCGPYIRSRRHWRQHAEESAGVGKRSLSPDRLGLPAASLGA